MQLIILFVQTPRNEYHMSSDFKVLYGVMIRCLQAEFSIIVTMPKMKGYYTRLTFLILYQLALTASLFVVIATKSTNETMMDELKENGL